MMRCLIFYREERNILIPFMVTVFLLITFSGFAQFNLWRIDQSFSTEWEATAFNNGRRLVRDSEGYLHTVYHSKPTSGTAPTGTGCSIFYAYSIQPCVADISPAQVDWIIQEIVPVETYIYDNRYPSIVIEHGNKYDPRSNDVLHVVWQREASSEIPGNGDYEIWYMSTFGNDIDIGAGLIAVWNPPMQLWNTTSHHDLVPSIACNYNNHLHVAWQAEGWDIPLPANSEILYIRSVDNGLTWTDNQGNPLSTFGGAATPYNISQTPLSSQCPSIACVIDAPTTPSIAPGKMEFEPGLVEPYTYTTETVHIAWHDRTYGLSPGDYHILYDYSPDDGQNWIPQENVTALTAGDRDIYVSLTVDYYDQPHLAWMHNCNNDHDPDPPAAANYLAGISPVNPVSFPGPDPGMYGALNQIIMYSYRSWVPPFPNGMWNPREMITAGTTDDEFPTIAMDEQMGVHLAWQSWGSFTSEYVIMITFKTFNWMMPGFNSWNPWDINYEITFDNLWDDLFPSEAHKKLAMYSGGTLGDFDLVWTKISGLGSTAAVSGLQEIWNTGATVWKFPPAYPMAPLNPQVQGKTNPTDVSVPAPNFTWTFNDMDLLADSQTAYRVLIASSSAILAMDMGDLIDTGIVNSTSSLYTLSPALPGGSVTYYWKVKTWDSLGLEGPYCPEQTFQYAPGVPVELSRFLLE